MSKLPKKSLFLTALLILVLPLITSITPVDPNLNITLTKYSYAPQDHLLGNIKFEITGPIENEYIKADIGEVHQQIKFIDALDKLQKSYQATPPVQELYGDLSQGIIFPPSPQLIGFKASHNPSSVRIPDDPEPTILGLASNENYPKFPYIDLKADGTREWLHLGNLTGWDSSFKTSGYLNENVQGHDILVYDDAEYPYFCEYINLGKDVNQVNVSVRYRLASEDDTQGTFLNVRIFGVPQRYNSDGTFVVAGSEKCSEPDRLPQIIGSTSDWASCKIEFNVPGIRNSDTLFCVYAEEQEGEELFYLDHDDSGTQTLKTAECKKEGAEFVCRQRRNRNYFIKINIPNYDGLLKSSVKFSEGIIGHGLDTYAAAIKDALSGTNCNPDEYGECIVPFAIGSQSEGIISIPNNLIRVDGSNIEFKKYREDLEIVTNISSKDLTKGYNLTIPLSTLENLTAPQVPYIQILPLKITFGSTYLFSDVEIDPDTVSEEDPEALIDNTLAKIEVYLSDPSLDPILEFLDLDLNPKKSSLQSYKTQIEEIRSNTTMSEQNKTAEIAEIRTAVVSLISDVPKELTISNEASNLPAVPPTQILNAYLPEGKTSNEIKDYVLSVQNSATIISKSIAYRLTNQADQAIERTLVVRDISTSLANPYVIEDIPSSVATVNEIEYKQPVTTVGSGATLKLEIRLGSGKLRYQILGDVTNNLPNIRTLIVSTEGAAIPEDGFEDAVCGDGTCTIPLEDRIICPEDCKRKVPWMTIIIIIIIFLILLYYVNFYKGKYSFRSLFHKKKLFKSEADKINLINYIERSTKHMSIEKVTRVLLSKGWSKEQINHALEQLDKKRKKPHKLF